MDIAKTISTNLTAWMDGSKDLDTIKKVEEKSGVGFGTVRRTKKGDGNLAKPPKLSGDTRSISTYDYEAQQIAKDQRCSIVGNGALERLANGSSRITYRCTDNRVVQVDCANAPGCQLTP